MGMKLGDKVTLTPTEGGYQKVATGTVVKETPTRITVSLDHKLRRITFNKATGRGQFKVDREFPNYIIATESEA